MSRVSRVLFFAGFGGLLAYLVSRQVAPDKIGELEMSVSSKLGELLARFEGFSDKPYLDQAGRWTIGFGHLIVPGDGFWHPQHNPTGIEFISVEDARALKEQDAATAINAVESCVFVPLTENQRNALVSLAYNIGASAFCGSSVVRALNAGDVEGAADAFRAWNKVRDPDTGALVVSAGLVKRREQERELFLA